MRCNSAVSKDEYRSLKGALRPFFIVSLKVRLEEETHLIIPYGRNDYGLAGSSGSVAASQSVARS